MLIINKNKKYEIIKQNSFMTKKNIYLNMNIRKVRKGGGGGGTKKNKLTNSLSLNF